MTKLEAIPTEYAGHVFRSRTEARWVAFFDLAGLRWEYEPEGVRLKGGWYLPDFWMPDMGLWVEVKPHWPVTGRGERMVRKLAEVSGKSVLLLDGAPWPRAYHARLPEHTPEGAGWMRCSWSEKYIRRRDDGAYHDGFPRMYWCPAEYEVEQEDGVAVLMAKARAVKLDEPTTSLPLGWEAAEVAGRRWPGLSGHLSLEIAAARHRGKPLDPGQPVPGCGCPTCTGIPEDHHARAPAWRRPPGGVE